MLAAVVVVVWLACSPLVALCVAQAVLIADERRPVPAGRSGGAL